MNRNILPITLMLGAALPLAGITLGQPASVQGSELAFILAQAQPASSRFPKVMTGMETNVSIQLLTVKRIKVREFDENVVLVQYRLKKEGKNLIQGLPTKANFYAVETKARDTQTSESFEVIRRSGFNSYSDTALTNEWKVGQQGDGFLWLKVPREVKQLDIFFPYTAPYKSVKIDPIGS